MQPRKSHFHFLAAAALRLAAPAIAQDSHQGSEPIFEQRLERKASGMIFELAIPKRCMENELIPEDAKELVVETDQMSSTRP